MVTRNNEMSGGQQNRQPLVFDMYHEGKMVRVRVEAGESDYGVFFDDQLMDIVEEWEAGEWDAQSGALDEETLAVIGQRISDYYG